MEKLFLPFIFPKHAFPQSLFLVKYATNGHLLRNVFGLKLLFVTKQLIRNPAIYLQEKCCREFTQSHVMFGHGFFWKGQFRLRFLLQFRMRLKERAERQKWNIVFIVTVRKLPFRTILIQQSCKVCVVRNLLTPFSILYLNFLPRKGPSWSQI